MFIYQFFTRFDQMQNLLIKAKQGDLFDAFQETFPYDMEKGNITISTDGNLQRISYMNKLLFESGKVELSDQRYVELSGQILKKFEHGTFKRIMVEGYTDDVPIGSQSVELRKNKGITDNWDLSAVRAIEVVRFLQEKIHIDPSLLSATGYSYHQSLSNDTEKDRKRNRKIEIVLFYSMDDNNIKTAKLMEE
jgi:chemotaxis protein MotB